MALAMGWGQSSRRTSWKGKEKLGEGRETLLHSLGRAADLPAAAQYPPCLLQLAFFLSSSSSLAGRRAAPAGPRPLISHWPLLPLSAGQPKAPSLFRLVLEKPGLRLIRLTPPAMVPGPVSIGKTAWGSGAGKGMGGCTCRCGSPSPWEIEAVVELPPGHTGFQAPVSLPHKAGPERPCVGVSQRCPHSQLT